MRPPTHRTHEERGMRYVEPGAFTAADDLWTRLSMNYTRLEQEKYWPQNVYQRERQAQKWPGDIEGRTLLSWVALARATGRAPRYVGPMLERWGDEVNASGYFGREYGDDISEQQLSGHGWMLRALAELDRYDPGAGAADRANTIVERLFLPTRGAYRAYPIDPAGREAAGEYSGTHQKRVGRWILSTDVGCFAIGMSGLVDAWERFRDDRYTALIDEMLERFLEIDLASIRAQTHATMTGCRAILKLAEARAEARGEACGDAALVAQAESRFRLYVDSALTETYANYNWFGRPQWTEPCAVVDSVMVAMDLYRLTRKPEYVEFAQLAYFNALGHGQRSNGGFGCDNCVGGDGETDLFFKTTESHWCCTMRGSEGLARVAQYQIAEVDDGLLLPFGLPGEYRSGPTHLVVRSGYPKAAEWTFENRGSQPLSIRLFVPTWVTVSGAGSPVGADRLLAVVVPAGGSAVVSGSLIESTRPVHSATTTSAPSLSGYGVRTRGPLFLADYPDGAGPICDDYLRHDMRVEGSRKAFLVPG
ncbi:MAG: hypothetical protein EA382_11230 [Spirochaetaceae bacterium]|nr:MAG: hypothetical protein EA382_11230 [Spirochaetaceae bacterium]